MDSLSAGAARAGAASAGAACCWRKLSRKEAGCSANLNAYLGLGLDTWEKELAALGFLGPSSAA